MSKSAQRRGEALAKFSALSESDRNSALSACRKLTDSIYEGLDLTLEIRSVKNQNLGETLLLWSGDLLEGFAVCQCGEGTEAGRDAVYIKFAAIRPGPNAESLFEKLLEGCETLAIERGLSRMDGGVNLNRSKAYRQMLACGFRSAIQGVAMHKPDSPAYNREDVFLIDDWR